MSDNPRPPMRKDWRGVDMPGTNFNHMNLEGIDFRGANLSGCSFLFANLRYADFRGANVEGACFQNACLYGAKMQGIEAENTDFRQADMRQVNLGGAYLVGAAMPAPSPADLVERYSGASHQPTQRQQVSPADLLDGKGTPSPEPDKPTHGHTL
jgi:uncharacterized protein YjbI with pentapeptide repeats